MVEDGLGPQVCGNFRKRTTTLIPNGPRFRSSTTKPFRSQQLILSLENTVDGETLTGRESSTTFLYPSCHEQIPHSPRWKNPIQEVMSVVQVFGHTSELVLRGGGFLRVE